MSLDGSAFLPLWGFADSPPPAPARSGAPLWPSSSSPPSPSRSTNRSQPRLARCAAAGFAAIGLLYATALLTAEWHYSNIDLKYGRDGALQHALHAAAWFPLEARFRNAPAYFYSEARIPEAHVDGLMAVAKALDHDLFALDLRLDLVSLLLEGGHIKEANEQAAIVHALAPLAKISVTIPVWR